MLRSEWIPGALSDHINSVIGFVLDDNRPVVAASERDNRPPAHFALSCGNVAPVAAKPLGADCGDARRLVLDKRAAVASAPLDPVIVNGERRRFIDDP
jgi:hypothetical protein